VKKALASDELKKAYEGAGFELPPAPNTPEQLAKRTQEEVTKWAAVIKKTGLSQD
jgi:tripartite-type tricarboxylate transporter receptor subunit TctC